MSSPGLAGPPAVGDDLKMIQWYKLANEAAMKAALVKHTRYQEVPRLVLNANEILIVSEMRLHMLITRPAL